MAQDIQLFTTIEREWKSLRLNIMRYGINQSINQSINTKYKLELCIDKESYIERLEINDSDIVVIDGLYREECSTFLLSQITNQYADPYLILFDNSDWYDKTISIIDSELKWNRVDFCGFGPQNPYTWVTSIFFNPKKNVPRLRGPISSIASLNNNVH